MAEHEVQQTQRHKARSFPTPPGTTFAQFSGCGSVLAPHRAKAAVAIAHTILVIVWHLLTQGGTYQDLGADYYARRDDPEIRANRLKRQLESLGYTVALSRAA